MSKFLLPLLGKSKHQLKYFTYFVNAFLDESLDYLLILYRFTGTEQYKEFESTMMSDPLFVNHIEYDNFHEMYKFKIPREFYGDVHMFMQSTSLLQIWPIVGAVWQ